MDRRTKATVNRDKALRLNEEWRVGAAQARYSDDGHWYALLDRFPAALFDAHGYVVIPTETDYRTSTNLRIGKQISVPRPGISALPEYVRITAANETTPNDVLGATRIPALAETLNATAGAFEIGRLQELRSQLRSRKRAGPSALFDRRTIHDDYAFHVGGRKELQFNIGLETRDGVPGVRHGVAFSFELSQSLPTIEQLLPKAARFNDYIRSHPEDFPGFEMWHYDGGVRRPVHAVMPIAEDLLRPGVFLTLGRWVPDAVVDPHEILIDFDRLLPLFAYVESDGSSRPPGAGMAFRPGCPQFVATATASIPERVTEIPLRHKVLQRALYESLSSEVGADNVAIEHQLELGVRVDAAIREGARLTFYELKVAPSIQACVRLAIGQLLEYAHWPAATRAAELVVVGEAAPDCDARAYLTLLRNRFTLPIWYRQLTLHPPALGPRV